MRERVAAVALAVLFLTAARVPAGFILQDEHILGVQIESYSPVGQTFIVEDPSVSIGYWIEDWNAHLGEIGISIELFEGAGTDGSSLGVAPIEGLSPGFLGFYDADFTSVTLTPGNTYTAIISSINGRGALGYTNTNPYSEGRMLVGFPQYPNPDYDAVFRVTPQAIPAPAAILLGVIGAGIVARFPRHRPSRRSDCPGAS